MAYNNEEYVSPHWAGFKSLWWTVAIILFLLILLMWLLGYGCGGDNCQVPVKTVERIVERPAIAPVAIAPEIVTPDPILQTIPASCVFNPHQAEANTNVVATCTGVEAGGSVSIAGMSCGDVSNGLVICETDQSGFFADNPTVITTGASGKSTESIGDFSLLASPLIPADIPAARVYFDISSDKLPANTTDQILASVITFLRDNSESVAYVSGFHDPSGNYEFNKDLSKRRAQSVEKLLLEAGISSERIILDKPVETTGTGASKEARRVEVTVKVNR